MYSKWGDLSYLLNPIFLGNARCSRRGLGDSLAPLGNVTPAQYNAAGGDSLFMPGYSPSDWWANLSTGNDSPAQMSVLQQQETQSLIQAGMPPAQAAAQAQSDVNLSMQTFVGPGAFDITWTGASPSSPDWLSAPGFLGLPNWLWMAGGGLAALIVLKSL